MNRELDTRQKMKLNVLKFFLDNRDSKDMKSSGNGNNLKSDCVGKRITFTSLES